jgi:hypothetical protein
MTISQGHGDEPDPELAQDISTGMAHPARVYDDWLGGKGTTTRSSWPTPAPC